MSTFWISALADAALRATALLGIAAAVAALPRHRPAAVRHFVWALALAGALALPLVGAVVPAVPVPMPWMPPGEPPATTADAGSAEGSPRFPMPQSAVAERSAAAPAVGVEARDGEGTTAIPPDAVRAIAPGDAAGKSGAAPAGTAPSDAWGLLLLGIWGFGAATLLAWSLAGIWNIRRLVEQATPVTASEWLVPLRDVRARLELRRPVRLLQSDGVPMPMTWGWRRPVILVPAVSAGWPAARRAVVLRHELAHVKRGDVVTQLFGQWACAVYWFNPLVWLAAFRLRVERERACDDEVLRLGTLASDYANHLLDIARECQAPGPSASSAVAMARPSQLEHRVRVILDPTVRRASGRATATLAGVILTAAVLAVSAVTPTTGSLRGETAEPSSMRVAGGPTPAEPEREAWFADWHRTAEEVFATVVWHLSEARRRLGNATTQPVGESPEAAAATQSDPRDQVQRARRTVSRDSPAIDTAPMRQDAPRTISGQNAISDSEPEWRDAPEGIAPRLAETFIGALGDPDADVRTRAARALGRHRVHAAATGLRTALGDEDTDVRGQAAWALGRIRDDASVDALLHLLRDPVQEVRERAAWALGTLRSPAAVDGLVAALEDADANVQQRIAWALGRIRDPRATDGLITALTVIAGDGLPEVIEALARIGGEPAMEALIELMDADDPRVRGAVIDALSHGNWIATDESDDAPARLYTGHR
jgi:beta-lactamase regulating signal transducer with metallopeptidase domain